MQWEANLIGYNASASYGSPSYYAQAMFGSHLGTEILPADLQNAGDHLFYSVTRDPAKGVLYLKLVNSSSAPESLHVTHGLQSVKSTAKLTVLTAGSTAATNSITEPRSVVPRESTAKGIAKDFAHTIPGYTIEVMEISAK